MPLNSLLQPFNHGCCGNRFLVTFLEGFVVCGFLLFVNSSPTTIGPTPITTGTATRADTATKNATTISTNTATTNATTVTNATTTSIDGSHPIRQTNQRNETMKFQIPSHQIIDSHAVHYYMSYACERDHLRLSCDDGYVIQIIRATYGRHSINTCSRTTKQHHKMCSGSFVHAKKALHRVCTGNQNCTVHVISRIFGNPCPKVSKYLEVYFGCIKEENSANEN